MQDHHETSTAATPAPDPTASIGSDNEIEQRSVAVMRGLALDAVAQATSGHTGTALSLAPLAHVLFTRVMRYDADDPSWPDRDRFVLSAGHASMLQYACLHLAGLLDIDELRSFRQWGSRTPGHPEVGLTPGVEVTTGPLGQGLANAVGMAMAERHLRARLGSELVDHRVWCIASDGDLMEGISHEAASLAGHQRLDRLTVIYDDNRITIDGPTELALSDDAAARFAAYGWHVEQVGDIGEDLDALTAALDASRRRDRPTLIILRTTIGHGLPTQSGTAAAHGAITDASEVEGARRQLGLPDDETFWVPDDVLDHWRWATRRAGDEREAWSQRLAAADAEAQALLAGDVLAPLDDEPIDWSTGESVATRVASLQVLDALAPQVPALVAGSADLTGNTGTELTGQAMSAETPQGRRIHYGVREHAMAALMNGMALHGGIVPVGGTFLVFSDYARPAIRLAALSHARVIYCFTHDSIGVGEDGPTHQPVEHLAALRAIPGLCVIRPADARETAAAWVQALAHQGPTALILSRQGLPVLEGTGPGLATGAYELGQVPDPDLVLVGTGSEVQLCVAAAEELGRRNIAARVVSMPSWELLAGQDDDDIEALLPAAVPTLAVEAGVTLGWERWADAVIGLDHFGASAPGSVVMTEMGFSADTVVEAALELLDIIGTQDTAS